MKIVGSWKLSPCTYENLNSHTDCEIGAKHLHRYTAQGIVEPRSVSSSTQVINSPLVILNRTNIQLHKLDCTFRSLKQR